MSQNKFISIIKYILIHQNIIKFVGKNLIQTSNLAVDTNFHSLSFTNRFGNQNPNLSSWLGRSISYIPILRFILSLNRKTHLGLQIS
jgi:hypothetical protein